MCKCFLLPDQIKDLCTGSYEGNAVVLKKGRRGCSELHFHCLSQVKTNMVFLFISLLSVVKVVWLCSCDFPFMSAEQIQAPLTLLLFCDCILALLIFCLLCFDFFFSALKG